MRVAIIGGGPSGLVTLKTLITAHEFLPDTKPIEAKIFEQEGSLGGTFKHRAYEDAEVRSPCLEAAKQGDLVTWCADLSRIKACLFSSIDNLLRLSLYPRVSRLPPCNRVLHLPRRLCQAIQAPAPH